LDSAVTQSLEELRLHPTVAITHPAQNLLRMRREIKIKRPHKVRMVMWGRRDKRRWYIVRFRFPYTEATGEYGHALVILSVS
jgi:hypothetical protein